ncbi:MAG TPA: ROK family protein [Candidatus Limnocylindria bacterium]|nr:ROK family protein [Candidatus Limnocylindria bacterium]
MSSSGCALAIDVGGTKISACLVDAAGLLRGRLDVQTDRRGGDEVVRQVIEVAVEAAKGADVLGVGVAVPAVVDRDRRVVTWAPNIRGWRNVSLAARLEKALSVPAVLEYDGQASAAGEHWVGAARGVDNVVMLVIGTGIGGGIICDGRLYRGSDGLAGAVGWLSCGPGNTRGRGRRRVPELESVAAGPAIARRGRRRRAQDVLTSAASGNARARKVIEATADLLGRAVADLVSLLNPDLVVLGGGVGAGLGSRLLPRIRATVRDHAQPISAKRARVVMSALGTDAGLFGAARAVFAEFSLARG